MKINRKQWALIKVYLIIFAGILLVINWDSVSWLFNYQEVGGLAHDFFNPYQQSPLLATANDQVPPSTNVAVTSTANPQITQIVQPAKGYPVTAQDNSLQIPAINLTTAVVVGQTTDTAKLESDLNEGVVYYPGSVLPGQPGEIVILGHSAPPGWPHVRHDWVFSNISSLKAGDTVTLNFNGHQYQYIVKDQTIIQQGQDVKATAFNGKNNVLELVSCWPPGKNYKRIVVQAVLAQ